jgi:hypothetical protein
MVGLMVIGVTVSAVDGGLKLHMVGLIVIGVTVSAVDGGLKLHMGVR